MKLIQGLVVQWTEENNAISNPEIYSHFSKLFNDLNPRKSKFKDYKALNEKKSPFKG
ncbi:MAG TPA: hypothetical protein HA306_01890 [Methanosarcina sp.]|nr:hypothetical protein [Methanosarcina sp.]